MKKYRYFVPDYDQVLEISIGSMYVTLVCIDYSKNRSYAHAMKIDVCPDHLSKLDDEEVLAIKNAYFSCL